MKNNLPNNWVETKLKDLGTYINGRTFKAAEWKNEGLPIIRIQNLNNNKASFNYSSGKFDEKFKVKNGDLLMAWSASLGVYFWKGGDAWLNQHIFKVVNNDKIILKNFLYYCLLISIEDFYSKTHGSGIVHITKPTFENHQVPLPPLPEQERIVAKLDALFAQHEAMKKALERIPQLLKDFRQQVLTQAIMGKLTSDWREDKNLDGKILLKTVLDKKQELSVKIKISNLEEFNVSEKLFPDTWAFGNPGEIADPAKYALSIGPFGSNLKVDDYQDNGVPLVFVRHIKSGNFNELSPKFISSEKALELDAHSVESLDLLITKMGEPPGDCEIYPENFPKAIITSDCLKFRVWSEYFNRIFYKHVINSSFVKEQLGLITFGVAQQKISLERFRSIKLPIPPLEEQQEIVSIIESLFNKVDIIEKRYKALKEKIDSLPQAILHKAFKGELVPQLPTDGDAKDLLKEILKLKKEVKKK